MKLSINTIAVVLALAVATTSTTVQAAPSAYTVFVSPKDTDAHSDSDCGDDDKQLVREMMDEVILHNLGEADESHRELYRSSRRCKELCEYWQPGYCHLLYDMCWPRRRALRVDDENMLDITPIEDHTPECAKMVVEAEAGMHKIAAASTSATCKSVLLAEKDYSCYKQ